MKDYEAKYFGTIVERNILSDNKLLFTLDFVVKGTPMKDQDGNRFFLSEDDKKYYYATDYNNCFNFEKSYCVFFDKIDAYKEKIKKDFDIVIEDEDTLAELISDVLYDTVYITEVDHENRKVYYTELPLPKTEKETKEMKNNLIDKYINNKNTAFGTNIKTSSNKNNYLALINSVDEKDKAIKELLYVDLPSLEPEDDYDSLIQLKEKTEDIYHDRILLSAYIKNKLDDMGIFGYFEEEFMASPSVRKLIYALKNKKINENDLDKYLTSNSNIIDLLNDYLNKIEEKILYGKNTKKIKEDEQKKLDFTFTILQNIKDSNKTISKLQETVISQDDAIKQLVTKINQFSLLDNPSEKSGILLIGSTGVGKTLLINTLAELLDKDICIIDSSQLVINGYKGTQINEALADCLASVDYNVERLENAIIFFDEIDKKGMKTDSGVSGKGVLDSLLKFLDGTTYNIEVGSGNNKKSYRVKTDNMLIIGGGSFSSVYDRKYITTIGFNGGRELYVPTEEDFITKGAMTKEFMGRFSTVIHLNDLEKEDYKKILLESKVSPLKIQGKVFDKLGVDLTYSDEYLDKVSELAEKNERGARGLKGIVEKTTWQAFSDITENFGDVKEIKLTKETVEDNTKYELIKENRKQLIKSLH